MRKLSGLVVVLLVAFPVFAEEVVIAPPETGSAFWDFLGYILGIVLVPLMGLLVKLIYEWQAKIAADKNTADLAFKEKLKLEVQESLSRIAENIANKQLAELKAASADGKVSKEELKKLGQMAIDQAKAEFIIQGIDLGKRLGDEFLASQLRNLVDKTNA